jgi:cytoskeleton protein RodZ
MNTIGETLRRERERQGLDLQKLSESTKIGTRMLRAMETGDLSRLPGGVFTRSFFKQYAAALGIDPAYVQEELRQIQPEAAVVPSQPETAFNPLESSEPRSNSLTAAAIWVVLALVGCGGVYYLVKNHQSSSVRPAQSAAAAVPTAKPQNPQPATSASPTDSAQLSAQPVSQPTSQPASQPQPIGSGSLQVVLNASEKSWVSVSVDGKLLFSGILQPNERREINAEEKVKVVAGNAGGIGIWLNGKNLETMGARGQVRTVELTRDGAQVVSRTKSAPLL